MIRPALILAIILISLCLVNIIILQYKGFTLPFLFMSLLMLMLSFTKKLKQCAEEAEFEKSK